MTVHPAPMYNSHSIITLQIEFFFNEGCWRRDG